MNTLTALSLKLKSLAVFRNLLNDGVISSLVTLLDSADKPIDVQINNYGKFTYELFGHTENLTEYVLNRVTDDENVYIKRVAMGKDISPEMQKCVAFELETLCEAASLTSEQIRAMMDYSVFLPEWKTSEIDFEQEYFDRCRNIEKFGYGIYAKYHMFCIKNGEVVPVKNPDPVTLADLSGYERERAAIIQNTKALLSGKPAANILLSGDAGTGKSSTVKAVVNEFKQDGLRIIEVRKDQLVDIPAVIDELHHNPLKFILFIDDLSFNKTDDNFSALKAILEGSVSAKSNNVVIYATSNRRHIVKESFADRDNGDDIHRNDTVQELLSLSERFGLCITFVKPDKQCYLDIVKNIAIQYGLDADDEKLYHEAERFALQKGGRSARIAKQFIDGILSSQ